MIGRTFGNFRIVEKLGDGGMGSVYRAHDEMLDRYVALKVLKPELARQAALIERFRQEAIALARLNHPRIGALHGMERHGEDLVMVMEFITGETLEAIIQRSGKVAWSRACELCLGILDALEHAHDKGVVHRDIKPANAMLTREGTIKVMDFGIARLRDKSRQTRVGHAVGTPMYMSPEQLRGEEVDGRADLYAVGAVLFELTTGQMAFEADSDYALMMKQLNDPPPVPSAIVAGVPAAVDAIVATAMAKRKDERYPNAAAMREALRRALGAQASARPRAPSPATRLASAPLGSTADHEVSLGAPPATRLAADMAPQARETSLASDSPATRLATSAPQPIAPRHGLTPDAGLDSLESIPWTRDWRTWVAAAGLFVATGLAVRTFARSGAESLPSDSAAGLTGSNQLKLASGDTTPLVQPPVADAGARSDTKPILPVVTGTAPVVTDSGRAPTQERTRTGTGGRRASAQPSAPTPSEKSKESAPVPEPPVTVAPAPQTAPEKARDAPPSAASEAVDERAAIAVGAAINRFASDVSGGNTGAVQSVIRGDGDFASQFLTVMREGRLAFSIVGEPAIDVQGARATARFSTSLNVRSAFGGNRRRAVPFVVELARSGGEWRVVSARAAGSVDLK